jgi:hypothetical protein
MIMDERRSLNEEWKLLPLGARAFFLDRGPTAKSESEIGKVDYCLDR